MKFFSTRLLRSAALMSLVTLAACSPPAPKASPEPTPTPAPAPTATPAPTAPPTPTPEVARYSGVQQMEYIKNGQYEFMEAREAKTEPLTQAKAAFNEAGGASAKGLTSKEAIAARRALIEKIRLANEDYLTFVSTQDQTYRQSLAKTPLMQSDIDGLVGEFMARAKTENVKKLRDMDRELLKTGDDMMAFLDKTYGSWSLKDNKAAFKKPADATVYNALGKKYNGYVQETKTLQADVNAALPTPGMSPIPSVPASPGASVAPSATVAAPPTSPAAAKPN